MANPNTPYGLRPYAYMSGAPYNGAARTYYVPVGNGTALYFGDPVNIVPGSSDGNGVPVCEIASAGSGHQITGVFAGITNNAGLPQNLITLQQTQTPYLAAAQAAYIYVTDDPFLLYAIQENSIGGGGAGGFVTSNAAAGANGNLIAGAGSTYSSQSGWLLDSSSVEHAGSDTTLQLRLIQALQQVDNSIGLYAKWLVKINQGISAFTNPASGGV
jgi:hypothetical protein